VKSIPLGRFLSVCLLCLAPAAFASSEPPAPVSLGNNTYSITVEASNAFHRDLDKLKDEATDQANKYCADQGKQMKLISLTGKVPMFAMGYAKAKIVFKALSPGDPELTAPVAAYGPVGASAPTAYASAPATYAPAPAAYAPAPAPAAEPAPLPHLSTDELYTELVKLDDLRKKGILTDDEFQAEKKKLLSRSN
jgi:Short C-terminal domain